MIHWPRRRWGVVVTYGRPGYEPFTDISPRRFWTKAGAEDEAEAQRAACVQVGPDVEWSVEAKALGPVPNLYADKYWQGDTYIGPEA